MLACYHTKALRKALHTHDESGSNGLEEDGHGEITSRNKNEHLPFNRLYFTWIPTGLDGCVGCSVHNLRGGGGGEENLRVLWLVPFALGGDDISSGKALRTMSHTPSQQTCQTRNPADDAWFLLYIAVLILFLRKDENHTLINPSLSLDCSLGLSVRLSLSFFPALFLNSQCSWSWRC